MFGAADELFGKPLGAILGKYAIGTVPDEAKKLNPRLIFRALRSIIGWKLR